VRAAAHGMSYRQKCGSVDLADADLARELLPVVADPLVESAFLSVYSTVLALSAKYGEALEASNDLVATAHRYRLDFAVPYALCSAATAHAGLRAWHHALRCLDEASAAARNVRDPFIAQACFAIRMRTLAQMGRQRTALSLQMPELREALPASNAEVICSHALVLASAGRVSEAQATVRKISGSTCAVAPAVLTAAVEAISALKSHVEHAIDSVSRLEEIAFSTGGFDLLVAAYRSTPELLAVLLRGEATRERSIGLIRMVNDDDLARAVGQSIGSGDDPRERLSRRESEVYDLLRQGLSNRQIAEVLFISESTVKLHAHHIYDKVGVRSRTALAIQAVLERADQATSAIGTSGVSDLS